MGRRSPGRNGGRLVGAPGRGRWKIGWPGTGRPGAGRAPAGAVDKPAGGAGRKGALYTGRGPVCGTIIRGGGACGAAGAARLDWPARRERRLPEARRVAVARQLVLWTACAAGAAAAALQAAAQPEPPGPRTEAAAGAAGAVNVGRGVAVGTTNFGAASGGGVGGFGAGGFAAGGAGAATGLVSTGGAVADGGAAAAAGPCCLLMMAFSASPGLEMWERSILVLISSASARPGREDRLEVCAWLAARNCARTLSASWSSRELEWLFFSVTPTSGSTSRIDLLLTSSSLARSLIRILLIRPFRPPDCPAKSSYQPHGVSFEIARSRLRSRERIASYCFSSEGPGSSEVSDDSEASGNSVCPALSSTAATSSGAASAAASSVSTAASSVSLAASALAADSSATSSAGSSSPSSGAATAHRLRPTPGWQK